MRIQLLARAATVLSSFSLLLAVPFAQAQTVRAASSVVSDVSLLSADIASSVERPDGDIVVRLKNDGARVGQTVHLLTVVRASSGQTKRLYTTAIAVRVEPGREQVMIVPIKGAEDTDNITVELVDPTRSPNISVFGFPVEDRGAGDQRLKAMLGAPLSAADGPVAAAEATGCIQLAQGGGESCPFCEWCVAAGQLLCSQGVSSFSCTCDSGPCDIQCAGGGG